jgi:pSer/pThr/pTyr-binding forkhead associated (FHA) protein
MNRSNGNQDNPFEGAYLVINNQIFPIQNDVTRIGRKLDNDLVIQDPLLSRHHAEIRLVEDKFRIFDLDSTGGTFLNNKKVGESVLYSGDIILLANVPVMFVHDKKGVTSTSEEETGKLANRIDIPESI